ncbi:extracellular solute-binding protein [Diaminobutyricibacter sp. McL0608]|uniref:extracellular solute-binding protein n=1 Tax=Leifsonia sp. McL0608 TaxID=3143537 RepID=UPI0031F2EFC1
MKTALTRTSALALAVLFAAAGLSGCSSASGGGASPASSADIAKAMNTPTTLTYWTWGAGTEYEVAKFEAKYPKIKVNVVNVGVGTAEYQKLRAAMSAGTGGPDAAFIEFNELPSFRLTGSLVNLAQFDANSVKQKFVPFAWGQVADSAGVWALPVGSGPMASMWRTDILSNAGIATPPETWDQFAQDAKQLKSKTGADIASLDSGNPAQLIGLLWQAGARPFSYDGKKTVGVDLDSATSKKVVAYWQGLIKDGLVSTGAALTNDWYQSINGGKIASWQTAAWGPGVLQGAAASTSGKWTVTALPQWTQGADVGSNWGGGGDVILKNSKNPIATYEFLKFIDSDADTTLHDAVVNGQSPVTESTLNNPEYTDAKSAFLGGQQVNKVYASISRAVGSDFEWPPFMDYVSSEYVSTVGAAMTSNGDMVSALSKWQQNVVAYAKDQGFTVK